MQSNFNKLKKTHIKILTQYVPIVARVHGGSHPEFLEVRKVYDQIEAKIKEARAEKPDLAVEFLNLREITNNYKVPSDVCESYEAVYKLLAELDNSYLL